MAGVGQIFKVEHHAGVAVLWGPSSHRKFPLDTLVQVDVPTDSGESDPYGAEVMRLAGPALDVYAAGYLD